MKRYQRDIFWIYVVAYIILVAIMIVVAVFKEGGLI